MENLQCRSPHGNLNLGRLRRPLSVQRSRVIGSIGAQWKAIFGRVRRAGIPPT